MCSGQRKVGGPYLSALLLQQAAELQANKPHYHHHHQQQISFQQLSAVHITALTAQTCTLLRQLCTSVFCIKKGGRLTAQLLQGKKVVFSLHKHVHQFRVSK